MKKLDLTGQRFGILTVKSVSGKNGYGIQTWACECDCGKSRISSTKSLRNGNSTSCGCIITEKVKQKVSNQTKPIGYTRIKKQGGRVEIKTCRGFIKEHTWIMENKLGRRLLEGEVVHHKDFNKMNNAVDNLQVMTNADHIILHHTGAKRSAETCKLIRDAKASMPGSKITRGQAGDIRRSDMQADDLAQKYNISRSHVYQIKNNHRWRENGIA